MTDVDPAAEVDRAVAVMALADLAHVYRAGGHSALTAELGRLPAPDLRPLLRYAVQYLAVTVEHLTD